MSSSLCFPKTSCCCSDDHRFLADILTPVVAVSSLHRSAVTIVFDARILAQLNWRFSSAFQWLRDLVSAARQIFISQKLQECIHGFLGPFFHYPVSCVLQCD